MAYSEIASNVILITHNMQSQILDPPLQFIAGNIVLVNYDVIELYFLLLCFVTRQNAKNWRQVP